MRVQPKESHEKEFYCSLASHGNVYSRPTVDMRLHITVQLTSSHENEYN